MTNNSTKILFLSCGDVLYENGYKTRLFGEMKLVSEFKELDKYFVTFEKKQSYDLRTRKIQMIENELRSLGFYPTIVSRSNRYKIDSFFDARKFANILKDLKFDQGIIHTQSLYACYMALLAKGSNKKIKIIFDMHGVVGPELEQQKVFFLMRWITNWVEKKCIKDSDYIITASESMKNYLAEKYESEKVMVLPCMADEDIFSKVDFENIKKKRKELKLPADQKIAVYLGGMQKWQNFVQIKQFVKRNNLFLLMITNNERVANATFADVKEKLVVSLPHQDVWKYLHLADMGILYREENELNRIAFPTKVAEYLLCGLPVIHNGTVDDIKSIIDDNGLGLNVEEMGENAENLDTSIEMKKKCRDFAKNNLIWDIKKEELRNLYDKLSITHDL